MLISKLPSGNSPFKVMMMVCIILVYLMYYFMVKLGNFCADIFTVMSLCVKVTPNAWGVGMFTCFRDECEQR